MPKFSSLVSRIETSQQLADVRKSSGKFAAISSYGEAITDINLTVTVTGEEEGYTKKLFNTKIESGSSISRIGRFSDVGYAIGRD